MRKWKKFLAILLSACLMAAFGSVSAFASSSDDDDDSTDYTVSGVGWDVSNSNAKVYWDTGDGKTSYKVEVYYSSTLKSKYRIASKTVSYSAGQCDVTSEIINHGSGTFYAVVTCKKENPSSGTKNSDKSDGEYIDSESITLLKANYKGTGSSTNSSTTSSTGSNGPGTSSAGSWKQNADGTWCYVKSDNTNATGWLEISGKWYYFEATGLMDASKWIPSAAEAGVWYYVGPNGDMYVSTTTPDGYTVDADGKWKG